MWSAARYGDPQAFPPPRASRPAPCASATKAALEAAVKADIDGGAVLFGHRDGTRIPRNAGTGELCDDVPAATSAQICGS